MNILSAILLGIIQGLTEFLPVSSSAHLVLAQSILGFKQTGVLFDVILHAATTFAVLWYFKGDIRKLFSSKMLLLIVIGTIPAGLVGLLFQDQLEALFTSVKLVGVTLLITGVMNYSVDKQIGRREKVDIFDSIIIGIAQAIAIIPGISRSGATIFAASQMGIERKEAARFSFLLSVPAIVGANILQLVTHAGNDDISLPVYLAGFIAAFIFGLISIHFAISALVDRKFKYFGYYAVILGVVAILFL